ncbi:MAG: hypothetical protein HY925_02710 [Elusimicrobia bacterium]|nr:hypothetical protein [Elusimicrobiota bacterium]
MDKRWLIAGVLASIVASAEPGRGDDFGSFDFQALRDAVAPGGIGGVRQAPAPAPAKSSRRWDVEGFSGVPRDQCDVGSCHAFGSVGVLEAAWWRRYREFRTFSEADLFLRRTVLGEPMRREIEGCGSCRAVEGGFVEDDLRFALSSGVATTLAYGSFLARYREVRTAVDASRRLLILPYDPMRSWRAVVRQPGFQTHLQAYLSGDETGLSRERAESAERFRGFRAATKPGLARLGGAVKTMPAAECKRKGADARAAIFGELVAGRPVVVSMTLDGLAAWGNAGEHAFVISGYTNTDGEDLVFHARNSWSNMPNPDVREDQLCRVWSVVTVLTAQEGRASWERAR